MMFQRSIRWRIITSYCIFGAVIAAIFACVVYVSLDFIDDNLVNTRLKNELEKLGSKYENKVTQLISTSPNIEVYTGTTGMPPYARKMIEGISEGIHKKYDKGREYHIAVKVFSNRTEPLYLFYGVSGLEFIEIRQLRIGLVLFGSVLLVIGLGAWMGWMISKTVIAPVIHLAEQVSQSGPDDLTTDLSKDFYDDEVGVLAKALEQMMKRMSALLEREQEFTRDTSHELRTPVTVIKGAVELLRAQINTEEKTIGRPLERIERAVVNMESIIESMLWLAREKQPEISDQTCNVTTVINEAIDQLGQVLDAKPVTIKVRAQAEPVLNAPAPIFRMTFLNLIQNAFRHTSQGEIVVDICSDQIVITDTGEGIASCDLDTLSKPHIRGTKSSGHGLGLAIVKRFCDRFEWRLEIESEIDRGTVVRLRFE
jgi:signal transduction histidine kinase